MSLEQSVGECLNYQLRRYTCYVEDVDVGGAGDYLIGQGLRERRESCLAWCSGLGPHQATLITTSKSLKNLDEKT